MAPRRFSGTRADYRVNVRSRAPGKLGASGAVTRPVRLQVTRAQPSLGRPRCERRPRPATFRAIGLRRKGIPMTGPISAIACSGGIAERGRRLRGAIDNTVVTLALLLVAARADAEVRATSRSCRSDPADATPKLSRLLRYAQGQTWRRDSQGWTRQRPWSRLPHYFRALPGGVACPAEGRPGRRLCIRSADRADQVIADWKVRARCPLTSFPSC